MCSFCASRPTCLSRFVPDTHQYVAGTLLVMLVLSMDEELLPFHGTVSRVSWKAIRRSFGLVSNCSFLKVCHIKQATNNIYCSQQIFSRHQGLEQVS